MSTLGRLGKLSQGHAALFVCDIQEKFRPIITGFPSVIDTARRMVRAANALQLPVVVTEQYPKALGNTVTELMTELTPPTSVFAKTCFSMVVPEVEEVLVRLPDIKQVMLVGIETHVCVLQTALDLLEKGYEVHVLVDGVSSQRPSDRTVGLQRLAQAGALMSTSEMALFQMMKDAKHPMFKVISGLVKEPRPEQAMSHL